MKGMINFIKFTNYVAVFMYSIWGSYFIFSGKPPEVLDKVLIGMLVFHRIVRATEENKMLDVFEEINKGEKND